MRDLKTVAVANAMTLGKKPGDASSEAITRIKTVIAIGDRALDALDLAYAKAWATSNGKPLDEELLNSATFIHNMKATLGKDFWDLYSRETGEQAIRNLEAATAELEAQTKGTPNTTATVGDIEKVGMAATKVSRAVADAKSIPDSARSTTNTA
jgi:hypothetical protein